MDKQALPQAHDWDHFWNRDGTVPFTRISWSKRRILKVLAPYARPGENALDAGCGSGFFSRYFCEQGMNTVALDYADGALRIAERMTGGRARLLKRDLLHDPLAATVTERFDLIFSDGLLEHFPLNDQNKIMQNLVSVLSDRGVLVTVVPNRWSPWELIRPWFMPGIEETPFVYRQLTDLHRENSLEVIASGGLNTLPWAFSPDRLCGRQFGMLLFAAARKIT